MSRHKHDTNGRRERVGPIKIGRDMVVYDKVYCTCGQYMTNEIVSTQSEN